MLLSELNWRPYNALWARCEPVQDVDFFWEMKADHYAYFDYRDGSCTVKLGLDSITAQAILFHLLGGGDAP